MDKDKLLKMRDSIESAKVDSAKAAGKAEALRSQLKKEFDCDTIEEAKVKITTLEKKISKLTTAIEQDSEQLLSEFAAIQEDEDEDD